MFVTLEDLQYMIILLECRLTCFQQIICKLPRFSLLGFYLVNWPFPPGFM